MKTFFRIVLFIGFSIILNDTAYSQVSTSIVRDSILSGKLRKYLLNHIDVYTCDSTGRKIPLDDKFLQDEYGQTSIVSTNLKADSVIDDMTVVGIYKFRFACYNGCRPYLYIKYTNRIEFIDIDRKDFDLDMLMKKILKLFKKYPKNFTLEQKVKTIQGVMDTIYSNKFSEYGW